MAFGLKDNLEKLLNSGGRMTNETINPSNLEGMGFEVGWQLPKNFLQFDEKSADAEIDKVTAMAEARVQGTRVIEEYSHLAEVELRYQQATDKLRSQIAKLEISREEGFAKWETLKHQLNVARRKAGLSHASDVEQANIAFANFQRNLQARLHTQTNTSRRGTESGSPALNRRGIRIAA
jgi:hypothetical protein